MAKKKGKKGGAKQPKGLFQSYGVYWKKDDATWEGKARALWGARTRKQQRHPDVDFWGQSGVYVLYNALFEPIYSGQANKIGARLRDHTRNRWLSKKWEYFSWFGLRKFNKKGDGLRQAKGHYGATAPVILDTLEAVLIAVGARTENKQGPKLHGALAYHQIKEKRQ